MPQPRFVPIIITANAEDAQAAVSRLTSAFAGLEKQSSATGNGLKNAFLAADAIGSTFRFLSNEIRQFAQEYLKFNAEIANVSTLLDANQNITALRQGILGLNPALGASSELTRGLYQALSSGVEAGESLQFIEASAKAARAGLATTFETVDAATTVINAFGLSGRDAMLVKETLRRKGTQLKLKPKR
jgi:hypothetical protein